MRTVCAIDIDRRACEVYRANVACDDVRCASVADELDRLPKADLIVGGPPCQPFSLAGKREGGNDARDCVPDFCAAIEKGQPRAFLMEQVPGYLSMDNGGYARKTLERMIAAGYIVAYRVLCASQFGVPQFRKRVWTWGIRADVWDAGVRHHWPEPTHDAPNSISPAFFGLERQPWVTCGEALGITGHRKVIGAGRHDVVPKTTRDITAEPSQTIVGQFQDHQQPRIFSQQSHADPARSIDTPAASQRSGGAGHDGCCVRLEAREYPWSEAMHSKHPPASPASPAPTVQAKWFKGGAEGLVEQPCSDGRQWESRHPAAVASAPAPAIRARSPRDGGRCTENVLTGDGLPMTTIFGEPVKWIRKGDTWMRRLSPRECARLQSVPDDFIWPAGISKTAMYRIVGNGWACGIAKVMGECLRASDPDLKTCVSLFCGGGLGDVGLHGRAWQRLSVSGRKAVGA